MWSGYAVSAASAASSTAAATSSPSIRPSQHVRVDFLQGAQELGPEGDVVPLAKGHEVPGGILGPFVGPFVPPRFTRGSSADSRRKLLSSTPYRAAFWVLTGTSLAAAWKISEPRARTTATGSMSSLVTRPATRPASGDRRRGRFDKHSSMSAQQFYFRAKARG